MLRSGGITHALMTPQPLDLQEDVEGISHAVQIVHAEVDRLVDMGVPERHVFIVGFSMGGCAAIHAAFRRPTVGGVMCMSSFLANGSVAYTVAQQLVGSEMQGRVVLCHGRQDPMVRPLNYLNEHDLLPTVD